MAKDPPVTVHSMFPFMVLGSTGGIIIQLRGDGGRGGRVQSALLFCMGPAYG